MSKAGWNWLRNSRKWHWFAEDGRSLCGRYMLLNNEDCDPEDTKSTDNCSECWKRRERETGKGGGEG